jgi:hypothetical protein
MTEEIELLSNAMAYKSATQQQPRSEPELVTKN